jgi:hypothetical protein
MTIRGVMFRGAAARAFELRGRLARKACVTVGTYGDENNAFSVSDGRGWRGGGIRRISRFIRRFGALGVVQVI